MLLVIAIASPRFNLSLLTTYQSDKIKEEQLYQVMKRKHLGLGNDETSEEEWSTTIMRDTYASIISHQALLEYVTLSGGSISKRETLVSCLRKMANASATSSRKHRIQNED